MAYSRSVGTTIQKDGEAAWVGATITYDSNLNVTVSNIYCNSLSDSDWTWRITGSYSIDNDTKVYAGEGVGYKFTSPKDGKTFVFGASPAVNNVSTGAWTNTGGSFIVSSSSDEGDSGGDSGEDSGGDSGDYTYPWGESFTNTLRFDQGAHTTITVVHTKGDYLVGETLDDGTELPFVYGNTNYEIQVIINVEDGYILDECKINNTNHISGKLFYYGQTVGWDELRGHHGTTITIKTRAIPKTYVYLDNKVEQIKYMPYIVNNGAWSPYTANFSYHEYSQGMFKATVKTDISAFVYLFPEPVSDYANTILEIPKGTELIISEMADSNNDFDGIMFKTTYNNKTGWVKSGFCDYIISSFVNNSSGTKLVGSTFHDILLKIQPGQTIEILSSNRAEVWTPSGPNPLRNLVEENGIIYGCAKVRTVKNNMLTETMGFIPLQDLYLPSNRDIIIWRAYPHEYLPYSV